MTKLQEKIKLTFLILFVLLSPLTKNVQADTGGSAHSIPGHLIKASFLNLKEDLQEAAGAGRVLAIFFGQTGCSYCELIHKVNFADKPIADLLKSNFDVVELDSLGSREVKDFSGAVMTEKQFAYKVGIQFSPMLVFYLGDGTEVFRMKGYYKPDQFKAALQFIAGGHYKSTNFRAYSAAHVPQSVAKSGLIDEMFFVKTGNINKLALDAKKRNKGVALLFTQNQCSSCVELHEEIFSDAAIVSRLASKYEVVRINVLGKSEIKDLSGKATTEAKLAEALRIRYTPTIVFLDEAGSEIIRYESYLKRHDFTGLVQFVTTDAWQHTTSFQDWLRDEFYAARKL